MANGKQTNKGKLLSSAKVTAPVAEPMSAIGREAFAENLAKLATGDKGNALEASISLALQAREDAAQGAVFVRQNLIDIYGDKLDGFPVPDSETGNNADKYTTQATNAKGVKVDIAGSFYKNFVLDLHIGRLYSAIIKGAKQHIAAEPNAPKTYNLPTDDGDEQVAYPTDMVKLANLVDRYETRITNTVSLVKRAMSLHLQWQRVEQEMPLVKIHYLMDDEDTIAGTTKPIIIRDADLMKAPGDFRQVTVTAFIGYDVDKALAAGGKWNDLIATGKGAGDSDDATGETVVNDDGSFYSAAADLVNFAEVKENMARLRKQLNQPGDEAKHRIATLCDLYLMLAPIYTEHHESYEAFTTKRKAS